MTDSFLNIYGSANSISVACINTTMPDGFSVQSFNIIVNSNDIKSYLHLNREFRGDYGHLCYERIKFDDAIIDDKLHNVYLTSVHIGDSIEPNNEFTIFDGYYYNGEQFVQGLFAFSRCVPETVRNFIYFSLLESSFFKSHVEPEYDYNKAWNIINERVSDLDGDYDDTVLRLIENIYSEYLVHKQHTIESPIEHVD